MLRARDIRRVLVVSKRSTYDLYVRQHRMSRVEALLRDDDPSVRRLPRADRAHAECLQEVREAVQSMGWRASFRERSAVGRVDGFDLVICVGGDGTLLGVSHNVDATPILGVNSAPADSVGFLTSVQKGHVRTMLAALGGPGLPLQRIERMQVLVDGHTVDRRVLNETLFAHRNPAMTARYFLRLRGQSEEHKSSGVWVGTAAGSTAAMRSAGGVVMPVGSRRRQFLVREPYTPDARGFALTRGLFDDAGPLEILNKMREAMLYFDGPRRSAHVEMGQVVRFERSPEPLHLVGYQRRTRFRELPPPDSVHTAAQDHSVTA